MKNTEIKNVLETNELHYLKALLDQVKDNQEAVGERALKAMQSKDKDAVTALIIETNRLADRQLQLLNMASDLVEKTEAAMEEAMTALLKQSAKPGERP